MKTLFALTKNTFREAVRDRILLVIVFFAVAFVLSAQLMAELSARQNDRIITDFGLAMINIFGVLITLFTGTTLIHKEIERKTIFTLLSKPIPRGTFILSKFFGLGAILALATLLMSGIFFLLAPPTIPVIIALAMMYLSFMLLLAIVLFFSSFMSPVLVAFASLITYVIGYITTDAKIFAEYNEVSPFFKSFANGLYYAWPNFELLNLKNMVLYGFQFTPLDAVYTVLMTVVFIFVLLYSGVLIFSKKEF